MYILKTCRKFVNRDSNAALTFTLRSNFSRARTDSNARLRLESDMLACIEIRMDCVRLVLVEVQCDGCDVCLCGLLAYIHCTTKTIFQMTTFVVYGHLEFSGKLNNEISEKCR
jgi:hypothetical protein